MSVPCQEAVSPVKVLMPTLFLIGMHRQKEKKSSFVSERVALHSKSNTKESGSPGVKESRSQGVGECGRVDSAHQSLEIGSAHRGVSRPHAVAAGFLELNAFEAVVEIECGLCGAQEQIPIVPENAANFP